MNHNLLFIIIIFVLPIVATAQMIQETVQFKTTADVEKMEIYYYDGAAPVDWYLEKPNNSTYFFNKDGYRTLSILHSNGNQRFESKYKRKYKIRKTLVKSFSNDIERREVYRYNKYGDLLRAYKKDLIRDFVSTELNIFDKNGQLVLERKKAKEDVNEVRWFRKYNKENQLIKSIKYYLSDTLLTIDYEYNEEDKCILETYTNAKGGQYCWYYKYYSNGVKKESQRDFCKESENTQIQETIKYQEDGQEIYRVNFNPDGSIWNVTETTYNEKGVITSSISKNDRGRIVRENKYRHDAKGNWIEEIQYRNGSIYYSKFRTIAYYIKN